MGRSPTGCVLSEEVWVLTYDHKHGTDILVYKTEEDAEKGAAQIMAEYLTDIGTPEECLEFLKYLEDKKYSEARAAWSERTGSTEFINVTAGFLHQEVDHPDLQDLKRDLEDQVGDADDGA